VPSKQNFANMGLKQLLTEAIMPQMTEFYFLRHGETDWNVEKRYQGYTDIPLNLNGIAQATIAKDIVARLPIDLCVVSPLQRAYKTAEIIFKNQPITLIKDTRIIERMGGRIEGMLRHEVNADAQQNPDCYSDEIMGPWRLPKDVEPETTMYQRINAAITDHIISKPHQKVLLVSHGGVIYNIFKAFNIIVPDGFKPINCQPYKFSKQGQQWQFKVIA
jgi:2,3-bisphosphoglycerate-dependent phosphoglycerate mutase